MKTALVTGASSGIGEATVRRLLTAGFRVYAAARRVERMAPLADAGAQLIALDLTSDTAIVDAVDRIRREAGRLDLIVNNAGYGSFGAIEDVAVDEGRRQFEVNLFAVARLVQCALPMMRAQRSGRIINVSSIGGRIYEPFGGWYHATKHALEGFSDCLRMEVAPFGIDVVVIRPGGIRTEWGAIAIEHLDRWSGAGAYREQAAVQASLLRLAERSPSISDPDVVAKTIVAAAQARRPRTRYATGAGARTFLTLRALLSDRAFDRLTRMIARTAHRAQQRTDQTVTLAAS